MKRKYFTFRPRGREQIELFRAGRLTGKIELIYWRPFDLQRHRDAPLFKEREEFLLHMLKRGSTRTFVQSSAGYLLRAIEALNLKKLRSLGMKEIDDATRKIWGQRVTRFSRFPGFGAAYAFRNCVKMFLLFHGKLKNPKTPAPTVRG